jgi:hypothetical protein
VRAAIAFAVVACGCSSKTALPPPPPVAAQAPAPAAASLGPQSAIDVVDPGSAPQLVNGFHPVEPWGGRWTKQSFTVQLKVPAGARERGATLRVKADTPGPLIAQHAVRFECAVAGRPLPPEPWSTAGAHVYERPVAGLDAEVVPVACKVDQKFVAPGDARDLGVVLRAIALEPN